MISHDLALKMKEAGFPQVVKLGSIFQPGNTGPCYASDIAGPLQYGLLYPNLEEVIEACGENFQMLTAPKSFVNLSDKFYHAGKVFVTNESEKFWKLEPQGEGLTPLEAVCNLWLAINKK